MPRSYTTDEIVDRIVDLLEGSPGSMPSTRQLAKALALSPSALYRYFPSMSAVEDAACHRAILRLIDEAATSDDPRGPLAAAAGRRPGLLWAITRIDTDRPPVGDPEAIRLTGVVDAPPIVRTAALSTVGVLWRLNQHGPAWASEVGRVLPAAVELFQQAVRASGDSSGDTPMAATRIDPPIAEDPIVAAVLDQVWTSEAAPSLRDVARRLDTPRTTAFRRLTAEQVADQVREAIYRRAREANTAEPPADPLDRILRNWLPAVDLFFERPALVDLFVRGSIEGNSHRELQRSLWAEHVAVPPNGLSHDDLTDVLAGFVMFCARRHAAGPAQVRSTVRGFVTAVLDGPSAA